MMLKIALISVAVAMVTGVNTDFDCFKEGEGRQEHGTSWIWERDGGRFKECVCPYHLTDEQSSWNKDDFCNGICFVGDKEYRYTDGDTWKETNEHGTQMNCDCQQDGIKDCFPSCAWAGEEHDPNEVWVQEVNGGRTKECNCPTEFPDGVVDWHPDQFCRGRCKVEGNVIYEGETIQRQRSTGVWVTCLCKDTSQLVCDET